MVVKAKALKIIVSFIGEFGSSGIDWMISPFLINRIYNFEQCFTMRISNNARNEWTDLKTVHSSKRYRGIQMAKE